MFLACYIERCIDIICVWQLHGNRMSGQEAARGKSLSSQLFYHTGCSGVFIASIGKNNPFLQWPCILLELHKAC